jgi:hypothetical protein
MYREALTERVVTKLSNLPMVDLNDHPPTQPIGAGHRAGHNTATRCIIADAHEPVNTTHLSHDYQVYGE